MNKQTFYGHLEDIYGNVLEDYGIILWYVDKNPVKADIKLGIAFSDSNGDFRIDYNPIHRETIFDNKSAKIKVEIKFLDEKIFEVAYTGNFNDDEIILGTIEVKGPNRGIKGRILDEKSKPLQGLTVVALGAGKLESSIKNSSALKLADKLLPIKIDEFSELGTSKSDLDGNFEISYPPSSYNNFINKKPEIVVVIKDSLGVAELFREKYFDVEESIKKIEDIQINRDWAEGWFVTLGGSEKSRYTQNNELEILIDNKIELENVVESIKNSKSYVYLTQFEFDHDFIATFDNRLNPKDIMVEVLRNAAERGVQVKLILNENLVVPDSYKEIQDYFKSTNVEVREFKSNGLHVMHAKTLVADGKEAYVIGSPFKKDYWDTSKHMINDPRRKPEEIRPVHDISVKLKGGSVYHVEEFFVEMWNYISKQEYNGEGIINPHNTPNAFKGEGVQIARSITPESLKKKGELGIFEGYRKAIAKAKDFIYIENQFFTNSSILKALKNAMKINDELQVIVVLNENPDNPGYKKWQNKTIEKLGIKSVEDTLEHPQIGFFTLWSSKLGEKEFEIQPIYVHTKMAIIDDVWATVGTANLDGSSLTHVNEIKGYDGKYHRNMEMNVIIPNIDHHTDTVKNLRKTLWNEHLRIDTVEQPKRGWLKIWQEIAQKNIKSLNKNNPYLNSQILPYSQEKNVEGILEDLKINAKGWKLLKS